MRSLTASIFAFALLGLGPSEAQTALRRAAPEIWFCPNAGSLDMLQLFEQTAYWPVAFARLEVFKFYQEQVLDEPVPTVGPNGYRALVAADAFRRVSQVWHRKIALEVGAIKDFYCTPDGNGMEVSARNTVDAIDNVIRAGGTVQYLALQEPFIAGANPPCGSGDPTPTLDRLVQYFARVRAAHPEVKIGLIEPYPYFSAATLVSFLDGMRSRGIQPAFFHLDVDLNALKPLRDNESVALRTLSDACSWSFRIPFGVIVWGTNGDADSLYGESALKLARTFHDAFGDWIGRPQQVIVQSWAQTRAGAFLSPLNLPESNPLSHTSLLNQVVHVLRGGSDVGKAKPR